jgi:hypothetical protein
MPETEKVARMFDVLPTVTVNGETAYYGDHGEEIHARVAWESVEEGYEEGPVNSAAIHVEEKEHCDRISLTVSVGDPRGAFVMAVEHDRETGELRLSVPHPNEGGFGPHAPMEPLASPGYYRVYG